MRVKPRAAQSTGMDVTVVLPECSDDEVSGGLRELTRVLMDDGHPTSGGLLGGEHGYGVQFENDTFSMHPYCWCEQDDCPWCLPCNCPDDTYSYLVDGTVVQFKEWLQVEPERRSTRAQPQLQCPKCRDEVRPAANFIHHPTGSTVHWYKYIGRGMDVRLYQPWESILADCLRSLQR